MATRILVAYASASGSTAEVAEAIGGVLRQMDVTVDVQNVADVKYLRVYDAVVVGSSIHGGRWLAEAIQFIEQFKRDLAGLPVAYFTTCLTMAKDDEESRRIVLSYMDPVLRLAPDIKPVGLGLFAGSLTDQQSLTMKRDVFPKGDYRNWDRIRKWAAEISLRLTDPLHDDRGSLVVSGAVLSYNDPSESRPADLDADSAESSKAHVGWANLQSSNLQGANLVRANMMGADLRRADLSRSNLSQAVLNGANLGHANLHGCDLSFADLSWADLTGADLTNANLTGANLVWANLTRAKLEGAILEGAHYNSQTLWPRGEIPHGYGDLVSVSFF
ncbi:MAG: pentapeptide repeat-containing protein [Caldilineaceae bacterium]|nr:pentapeptide repeat-containing protein [Caldilineaceae bacterium]